MNVRSPKNAAKIGTAAKACCVLMLLTAMVLIFIRSMQIQSLELRGQAQEAEAKRLNGEGDALRSELKTRDTRVKQVGQEIQEQLQARASLQIAMSEVLSRVKVLRQQQDKFNELRDEIDAHLQKMDDYYMRARQQAPGVLPP